MRLKQRAAQLTLLPEARLASPPAWQDDGREVLTCDGSCLSFSASAARLVPAGSWQRTLSESLASSLTGSTGCAVSLRLRATKCGRSLLVPTTSAPHTEGTESGSWPTPHVASERTGVTAMTREGHWSAPGLMQVIELVEGVLPREVTSLSEIKSPAARALWPTATSSIDSGSAGYSTESGRHSGTTLTDAANGLWASPQARDWKDSGPTQGNRDTLNLGTQASRVAIGLPAKRAGLLAPDSPSTSGKLVAWPTPRSEESYQGDEAARAFKDAGFTQPKVRAGKSRSGPGSTFDTTLTTAIVASGTRGSLNPAWVSQLMGFPTGWLAASPPVTAGKPSRRSGIRSSRSARK